MRLATITNWAYGATVALTLASGTTMLLAANAQERERSAVEQRYALDHASSTIDEDVAALSGLARQYVISGEASDLIAYQREAGALKPVEGRTRRIRDAGASLDELRDLHEAMRWADALQGQQAQAIAARQRAESETAIGILFSPEYERELDRSLAGVARFQEQLDQRTENALRIAIERSALWRATSEVMLAATALLFLFVLFFVFRRRVLHPVVKLSDVVGRLASQDFAAEPPVYEHIDEIGDMAQALRVFRENGIARLQLEQERDADRVMRDLLSRMTQRMQSCDTIDDLKRVVERFVPEVAPHLAGRLYLLDPDRNAVVEACSWLEPKYSRSEFPPLSCWALRRGSPHLVGNENVDVPCSHVIDDGRAATHSACLPLTGQNGILGLLYFERRTDDKGELTNMYVALLAENVGLALDNLRLRDALRSLALIDPLTNLANRRELDLELASRILEAEHNNAPLGCAMIDIDHFKQFNDKHGHDAGDAVLREVAAVLKGAAGACTSLFRFGGEEFLVLFPGLNGEEVLERTERIREAVAGQTFRFQGHDIGPVTVSIGVATAPLHCEWARLVQTADAALLNAKRAGRNRVIAPVIPQRRRSSSGQ